MRPVERAILVPVKAFGAAKARLSPVLSDQQRAALARGTAQRVLDAADATAVFVVCDDRSVAGWAAARGAEVLWHPGVGLNAAVQEGVASLAARGAALVTVAHGDLPLPTNLSAVAADGVCTLVPDRRRGGTNVLALPAAAPFQFSYGPGSFRRHLAQAVALGMSVRVVADDDLALDIDTPDDLAHPRLAALVATLITEGAA
jgi:2-phospho-L-lactate/phosphoenolpyruvate guanylyltransferase